MTTTFELQLAANIYSWYDKQWQRNQGIVMTAQNFRQPKYQPKQAKYQPKQAKYQDRITAKHKAKPYSPFQCRSCTLAPRSRELWKRVSSYTFHTPHNQDSIHRSEMFVRCFVCLLVCLLDSQDCTWYVRFHRSQWIILVPNQTNSTKHNFLFKAMKDENNADKLKDETSIDKQVIIC